MRDPEQVSDSHGDGSHPGPAPRAPLADDWPGLTDDLWWAATDLDTTLERVAQRASRVLDASSAVFSLTGGQLVPRAFWHEDDERRAIIRSLFDRGPAPADEGQLGQVLRSRQPVLAKASGEAEETTHYRGYVTASQLTSYLILPLMAHNETLGLLAVGRHADQLPLTAADQATAEQLAESVAHIVRIAALVEHLRVADTALKAMSEAVIGCGVDGRITSWNRGAEQVYGWSAAEVLGRRVAAVLQPGVPDLAERHARVHRQLHSEGRWAGRADQSRRDGSRVIVDSVVTRLYGDDGALTGVVLVNRDMSREIEFSSQLHQQQVLAQAALDSSPVLTAVADASGVLLAASRGWAERIGPENPIGTSISDAAARLLPDAGDRTRFMESFTSVATDQVARADGDFDVSTPTGGATFSVHVSRVADVGAAITVADVTDRASRERALTYSAGHDSVTRLPNRTVFMKRAIKALDHAAEQGAAIGLLFCDLDGFKDLNDRYGHGVGDGVLQVFGDRLRQSCRSSDVVARIGGDEFVLLLADPVDSDVVSRVARRIVQDADRPMQLSTAMVSVTASVGAVLVLPEQQHQAGAGDVEALLAQADAAMYEAKRQGKNRWVFGSPIAIHVDGSAVTLQEPADQPATSPRRTSDRR